MYGGSYYGRAYYGGQSPIAPAGDTRPQCGGVYGSATYGQTYYGNHLQCGVAPPPPPPPAPPTPIAEATGLQASKFAKGGALVATDYDTPGPQYPWAWFTEDGQVYFRQRHRLTADALVIKPPKLSARIAIDRIQIRISAECLVDYAGAANITILSVVNPAGYIVAEQTMQREREHEEEMAALIGLLTKT